jgi:hypothetical protein
MILDTCAVECGADEDGPGMAEAAAQALKAVQAAFTRSYSAFAMPWLSLSAPHSHRCSACVLCAA